MRVLAIDVQYQDPDRASVAGVLFTQWGDDKPSEVLHAILEGIQPYQPGEFFRRELPCVLHLLGLASGTDLVIVDGYVDVQPGRAGLGRHLFDHLGGRLPVIGVAKTWFHDTHAVQLLRGGSTKPLFITSAGMEIEEACAAIRSMAGPHRIPTLLKLVDQVARQGFPHATP